MKILGKQVPLLFFLALMLVVLTAPPALAQEKDLFEKPFMVKVNNKILDTGYMGYAAPYLFDFNGDGKNDLLVGYWGEGDGELLIYYNEGTNLNPKYKDGELFEVKGNIATVPPG